MLWTFRYRNKFNALEASVESPDYDLTLKHAAEWCKARDFHLIPNSVKRAVLFTVNMDGTRTEHDPTGRPEVHGEPLAPAGDAIGPVNDLTGDQKASTPTKARKAS